MDPDGYAAIEALRTSGRLPVAATWFSSPERKARETAARLTDEPVAVVDDLAEQRREARWFATAEELRDVVRAAFARPDVAAVPEWPLSVTRERVVAAVHRLRAAHPGDLVLVGHGTAWTVLAAALTGAPPDLDAWARLAMPDLWVVEDMPPVE
ncbi:MAG TPA: histidine phosphatase family protein [Nocardioides sp.]|nr:histidine phosphatase family protein [Nocardioides sp.]